MPNLNHGFWGAIMAILTATSAGAATCDPGYYMESGSCTKCKTGFYCPGDDTAHTCPTDTTDWRKIFSNLGHTVQEFGKTKYMSWCINCPISAPQHCVVGFDATTTTGVVYVEQPFTGTDYHLNNDFYWYMAKDGYYLSPYRSTSSRVWYRGTKSCTNAPAHAHYTGPGTPDAPDGSVLDANDCPWECDDGFGRVGDECKPLCNAGITHIHAGTTTAPLFPVKYTTPTLVIRTLGGICYGNLTPGNGNGVNVTVAGTTYRME